MGRRTGAGGAESLAASSPALSLSRLGRRHSRLGVAGRGSGRGTLPWP